MTLVTVEAAKNLKSVMEKRLKDISSPAPFDKDRMIEWVKSLQNQITSSLEKFESHHYRFKSIFWDRPGGGGGESRILENGEVFEKAGVNVSVVHGELPELIQQKFKSPSKDFFATGISLVIHPRSPQVPTVHANWRYFEQPDRAWFGGGADITPYTISEESFSLFHRAMKAACDSYKPDAYSRFKKDCDEYFRIQHRNESRGLGGIFFDYQSEDLLALFDFCQAGGKAFAEVYPQIVSMNYQKPFSERQKKFQLLRRGRYTEFNLVYDRGTSFGLQTKGNIESILMSLPPVANFDFNAAMETTDEERKLMGWFREPRDWI